MKKSFVVLFAALAFASCQKEIESDIVTTGSTNNNNNNTGSGSSSGPDYQPATANSKWNMKSTSLGDYTILSLGTDTTINGKKFYKFDQSAGGRVYMNKENGVYSQYTYAPQLGGWAKITHLKDAAVGTTWTETINSQGTPVAMKYTIIATGSTRTVNNKTYPDVIKVSFVQSVSGITTSTGDQYYAKGVGPIDAVSRIDLFGMSTTVDSTYLVSAVIN